MHPTGKCKAGEAQVAGSCRSYDEVLLGIMRVHIRHFCLWENIQRHMCLLIVFFEKIYIQQKQIKKTPSFRSSWWKWWKDGLGISSRFRSTLLREFFRQPVWYCWRFRNPAVPPVEVGSWNPIIYRGLAPSKQWLALGFLNHQQSQYMHIYKFPFLQAFKLFWHHDVRIFLHRLTSKNTSAVRPPWIKQNLW